MGLREGEDGPEARDRLALHLESLRSVVRRVDADLVVFQELLDPALLDPLLDGFDYPHRTLGDRGASPLLVGAFSRQPLGQAKAVAAGVDLNIVDRKTNIEIAARGAFSRPALQVEWAVPGFPVTLIVVHWKSKIPSHTPARSLGPGDLWASFGDAGEARAVTEMKRLAQAVQVRRAVDRVLARDPAGRLMVLGDFNDTLESEVMRVLIGDARACTSPGLAPAELVACERSIPQDLRFTQLYRGEKQMIDHILISRGLLPHFVAARAFNEGLRPAGDDTGPDPYNPGSDHAPLAATFHF